LRREDTQLPFWRQTFPREFQDIKDCLAAFTLRKSEIVISGGGRARIPIAIDGFHVERGWEEKKFDIEIAVDGDPNPIPSHKIDNFKNRVGVEVKWNNKTEFYAGKVSTHSGGIVQGKGADASGPGA
jgi:hypothetical protein